MAVRAIVLWVFAGCSFIAVPTPRYPAPDLGCGRQVAAPIADTIVAAAGLAAITYGMVRRRECTASDGDCLVVGDVIAVYGAITLLVNGTSATYGFTRIKRCRELEAEYAHAVRP